MTALLMTALLAFGQAQDRNQGQERGVQAGHSASTSLDGEWNVLYMERDGQRVEHGDKTVKIHNNTVTFTQDNKQHTMQFQFGPQHTISSRPVAEGEHVGQAGPGQQGQIAGRAQRGQPTQPGQIGQRGQIRQSGYEGQTGEAGARGPHQGVYIFSGDILCLGFDQAMSNQPGHQDALRTRGRAAQGQAGNVGNRPIRPGETPQPQPGAGNRFNETGPGARGGMGMPQVSNLVIVLRREGSEHGTTQGTGNR